MVRAELCSHVTALYHCQCLLPPCPRGLTTEDGKGAGSEKTGTATGTGTKAVTQEVQGQGDIAILDADETVVHVAPGEVCQLWIDCPESNLAHCWVDKRDHDRDRDYKGSRRDDRRDYDRDRDDRRPDRRGDRKSERKYERMDEKRDHYTPERIAPRDKDIRPKEPSRHGEPKRPQEPRSDVQYAVRGQSPKSELFLVHPVMDAQSAVPDDVPAPTSSKSVLDPDTPIEDGEEMDATTAEDEPMMAMMGLTGFGSTKV